MEMRNPEQMIADILYGTDITNQGLKAFMQAVLRGRMKKEEALLILECSPRLAESLMQGLAGSFGEIGPRRFVELAHNGQINGGALSRAL